MKLLDLYCGAGGSAMGYKMAGFTYIVGVDIKEQPHYPFHFIRADVLDLRPDIMREFDFIHASPPCQKFSMLNQINRKDHPDLISPTRELLKKTGRPYIIENVPQAPLIDPIQLCGGYFGLGVGEFYLMRHRHFESNLPLIGTPCNHFKRYAIGVYGGGHWDARSVNPETKRQGGYQGTAEEKRQAMGISWMNRDELAEAIPPAYTEYLGLQVIESML